MTKISLTNTCIATILVSRAIHSNSWNRKIDLEGANLIFAGEAWNVRDGEKLYGWCGLCGWDEGKCGERKYSPGQAKNKVAVWMFQTPKGKG